MGSSRDLDTVKLVVDSVHGDIHLTEREWRILDTAAFQRLRSLKQLGMGQVTYPNATHTRFAHSLGTLGIMGKILEAAERNKYCLSKEQKENLRMAALLHDVGHYPYSHLMERIGDAALTEEEVSAPAGKKRTFNAAASKYPSHEKIGVEIVTHQQDLIKAIGGKQRAKEVADLFARTTAADPQLSKLLHSSFDMDRVDYLQRDSRAAGVPYGNIDVNYLLNSLRISKTGMLGVAEKAMPAAEQYLFARFFMHRAVYYHKTTYGMEEACRQLLRRLRDSTSGHYAIPKDGKAVLEIVRSPKLMTFTDAFVDSLVDEASHDNDKVISALAKCISTRRPPKLLKEVQVFKPDGTAHHEGCTFMTHAKGNLKALAKKYHVPLELFLLCQTKPLRLEERGARMTFDQAKNLPAEQEDEVIKVFVAGKEEPTSMLDILHSLLFVCSGHFYQAYRLYVVCDKAHIVKRMQTEVSNWGKA